MSNAEAAGRTRRPASTGPPVTGPRPAAVAVASDVPAEEGHPARWWIMAVLAAVAFMAQLDLFIVNVALPVIGRSYPGSSLSGLSWVLNAYAIIFAALLVPAGRLADHFGGGGSCSSASWCSPSPRPRAPPRPPSAC